MVLLRVCLVESQAFFHDSSHAGILFRGANCFRGLWPCGPHERLIVGRGAGGFAACAIATGVLMKFSNAACLIFRTSTSLRLVGVQLMLHRWIVPKQAKESTESDGVHALVLHSGAPSDNRSMCTTPWVPFSRKSAPNGRWMVVFSSFLPTPARAHPPLLEHQPALRHLLPCIAPVDHRLAVLGRLTWYLVSKIWAHVPQL